MKPEPIGRLRVLRVILAIWMIILFPVAMSAKVITFICFGAIAACAIGFGISPTKPRGTCLAGLCLVFVGTFFVPFDVRVRGFGSPGVAWVRSEHDTRFPVSDGTNVFYIT